MQQQDEDDVRVLTDNEVAASSSVVGLDVATEFHVGLAYAGAGKALDHAIGVEQETVNEPLADMSVVTRHSLAKPLRSEKP